MRPLVAVLGPTGSGKSSLAAALAARFGGEVVSCDSVQVYRHFDTGSAKTPVAGRRGVPHHLIDIREPGETYTAGDFARDARAVIAEISARGRLPVAAGGTGFYVRALFDGLFEGPPRDERLRESLTAREAKRPGALHRILRRIDPAAAARIHHNDRNKQIRAIEVIVSARRPLSDLHAEGRDALTGYDVLKIGLNPPREELYRRIERRCEEMFRAGLIEETRAILARGFAPSCKPFESLGYAQAAAAIRGELTEEEALAATRMWTRRYAKRQWTWFRRERDIEWIDGFGDNPDVEREAAGKIERMKERFPSKFV